MTSIEPGSTWQDVSDQARTSPDPEHREVLLTAILAAALALSPESLNVRRAGGYPSGVPDKALVRSAAQLLLDLTASPRTDRSRPRRALALTFLLRLPQKQVVTVDAPDGEIVKAVENCRRALAELSDAGDPTDRAIVALQLARYLRRSNQSAAAVEALTLGSTVGNHVGVAGVSPRILHDAPFLNEYLSDKLAFKYAEVLYSAYMDLGLLEKSMRQVEVAREYARRYEAHDPANFTHTWQMEGQLYRRQRNVRAMLQMEESSKTLAARYPQSAITQRYYSSQASSNAALFQDFSRARELRYQRLRNRLTEDLGKIFDGQPTIEDLMDCVEQYRRLGSKAGITWLGNITYDLAAGYVRAGDTATDPRVRVYAEGLLDVAESAWNGFATNGVNSLLFSRARLALMSGDTPTAELTADLLTANRNAYRWATAHNALIAAVRYGVPGSMVVRGRLVERLAEFDPNTAYVAHAKTVGLSAEWWWRTALTHAGVDWERVEAEALTATRTLRLEGVSIEPESEAVAWMTAARALTEIDPTNRTGRLQRLLRGIGCVTELMLTIATTADRRRIADKFGALFTDAANLAVALGDHQAADLIMEAVRRDRVGLLLAELARNPDIDTSIRSAALAVQDSGSATVDSQDTTPDASVEEGGESGVRGRSTVIAVDRATAVKAAESVLGPLSALADPRHLDTVTAAAVLDRRGPSPMTTVVLQLLPLPAAEAGLVPVLRRVTIAAPGAAAEQFTDRVDVDRIYLDLAPGEDRVFVKRRKYTPLLLPPVLTDLLAVTPVTAPVRLLIVPTGFFHIPFDALPVTSGTHVLDHALVSIHGSLTSALSLMELDEQRAPTPALAVYDHTLTHARPELDALLTALDGVRRIDLHQELDAEMAVEGTQPHSLLAMAVHGSADDHGWGQAKKLRDENGNTVWVTAAHALSWTVPRLCVLASCNTPIAAPDGIEVGGFPLALMLRGATTVIGGLYNIDDKATSDIMIAFWRHLAAGEPALAALRLAKLNYLQRNPGHRSTWPEYWAGLTVYGSPGT
ncbi:CHAT domain-containing protein [Rhodococcus sp. Q]|uniref:CHAT domain-containing protein n=1 Tax=Rhodococcus sp. Q TaxID=2502252 RepID=UPI0010FA4126|nr:CHAT domain-containing protein [Rhodococcus sp. Q]